MGRKLSEVLESLPPEQRARVAQRRDALIEEVATIRELREALGYAQTHVARQLNVTQPAVSKMERQADMTLSALRNYVESLGGTVEIHVQVPNRSPVRLEMLEDLEESPTEASDS